MKIVKLKFVIEMILQDYHDVIDKIKNSFHTKRENFERKDQFKKLDLSEKTAKIWKNRPPVRHEYLPYLKFNDIWLKKYFIYQVMLIFHNF